MFLKWHRERFGPCKDASIEHIVPRSLFASVDSTKELHTDMHNFLVYPKRLNSRRGDAPMSDRMTFTKKAVSLSSRTGQPSAVRTAADLSDACISMKRGPFLPDKHVRGRIARSVAYVMSAYPELAYAINDRVLDVHTLVTWHHMAPVDDWEVEVNAKIRRAQGSGNEIIEDPGAIWEALAPFRLDRDLFSEFDYSRHYTSNALDREPH